jgi:hypothetical protein
VLAVELWPLVFPHFSNLVSLSQSRRLSGFIPFSVALAGGAAIVARFSRTLALVGGLAVGIWLQVAFAGDFGLRASRTAPAIVVWIALYGGIAALIAGALLTWRRYGDPPPPGSRPRGGIAALAVFFLVLPVAVHGFSNWTPEVKHDRDALTPGLIHFLRHDVAPRSVLFSDLATSYRATGFAPVYVVAVPPTHAANTRPNELAKRRRAVLRFFTHPSLEEPQAWRAQWLVLPRSGPVHAIERRGLRLVLDFVPNHVAPDHPWVTEHPEYFVRGNAGDAAAAPDSFVETAGQVFACGKDPFFPAWPDVLQLNAFAPGLRQAVVDTVSTLAEQCDGLRCDMAMLVLNTVFERTWGARAGDKPADDYWKTVIPAVKAKVSGFRFIAEAYWDLEWELQQQGFDHCYDKKLYDRMEHGPAESVREHLLADPAYQKGMVRFIENHDEPRAAATFPDGKGRAAAVAILTLPGARLLHEGGNWRSDPSFNAQRLR